MTERLLQPLWFIAVLVLSLVAGFVLPQLILADNARLQAIITPMKPYVRDACLEGIRLPGVPCEKMQVAVLQAEPVEESLTVQFARYDDLREALKRLDWRGNSDVEAAQYLSLLHSLSKDRAYYELEARKQYSGLLDVVWRSHPQFVFASRCFNCGHHSTYLRNKFRSLKSLPSELSNTLRYGPELTHVAVDKGWLDEEEGARLRRLQGELVWVWYGPAASSITGVYLQDGDMEKLRHFARRTGARALVGHDISTMPEIAHSAWEEDVISDSAKPGLTEYLIRTGYRPALRWAIWSESGIASYLKEHGRESIVSYRGTLQQYTDFPELHGRALTDYYSRNWESIEWDAAAGIWRTAP